MIRNIDADIINLVEVQSCEILYTLNNDYLSGMRYQPYLLPGTDTHTGWQRFHSRATPEEIDFQYPFYPNILCSSSSSSLKARMLEFLQGLILPQILPGISTYMYVSKLKVLSCCKKRTYFE